MTTPNSTASKFCVAAIVLALLTPALSFADTASTNASPAPAPAAEPAPAPTPAPADTTTTPTGERPTTYTMVAGDTLDSIAKKFDTSIHALAKLNNIPHSMYKKLRAGKVLQIPPANSDASKTDAAK